jgi:16S rRNA C967 or C1407 C5-methylase (RsmB/RsmF family)/NOL1/NOP2/fmu family ribosome biogenesis protein
VKESLALPEALLRTLRDIPGFDEPAFIAAHQQAPPTSLRLHPHKGAELWAGAERVPWCPDGRYLNERPLFTLDPLFHAGAYYVQEASSMLLHFAWQKVMENRKGLRVLDLCAAPGGKSTLLASALHSQDLLLSNEVIRSRATILEENMIRWGCTNSWVSSNDPRDFGRMKGYFDAIVVDAPCSGSGLFRKDARALEGWSEDLVNLCSARQQRILADVWPALKEGGVLFYATCSYSPQENEEILDWMAEEFDVATIDLEPAAEWGLMAVNSPQKKLRGYRCFPDKVKGEGFFLAALKKRDAAEPFYYPRFRAAHPKQAEEAARKLMVPGPFSVLEDDRKQTIAINPWNEPDYHFLKEYVYLRKAGVRLGTDARKDWIPEHDVALSVDRNPNLPVLNLKREEALRYLKKEEVSPSDASGRGWFIASFEGRGLGWVKVLSNRINNYLPRNWRIRMELPDEDESGTEAGGRFF